MEPSASSRLVKGSTKSKRSPQSCVLHVCTSCRAPGAGPKSRKNHAGFKLYQALRTSVHESLLEQRVEVRPVECLSLCPRPCGIALTSPGAWTYLFGDQCPDETLSDIVACVSLYIGTADGFMWRYQRPERLRASILGRVPPLGRTLRQTINN